MWYNGLLGWLIRSPIHGMVSGSMMLLTWTGRKSGKTYSTPVNYLREGDTLWVTSKRDRTWWRNLIGGAPVQVRLAGRELQGRGKVIVAEQDVADCLADYFRKAPQLMKYFGVKQDAEGNPDREDCCRAAKGRVMVRIDVGTVDR